MKVQRQAGAEALTSRDCSETVAELLLNQILYNRRTRFDRNVFQLSFIISSYEFSVCHGINSVLELA